MTEIKTYVVPTELKTVHHSAEESKLSAGEKLDAHAKLIQSKAPGTSYIAALHRAQSEHPQLTAAYRDERMSNASQDRR